MTLHAHVERPVVTEKEKPRSGWSTCIEDRPRSSATPSARVSPGRAAKAHVAEAAGQQPSTAGEAAHQGGGGRPARRGRDRPDGAIAASSRAVL